MVNDKNKKKDPRKTSSRLSSMLGALAGSLVLLLSPFPPKSASATDAFVGTEETEWERVAALGSADAIQAFIEQFPDSPRVADAFDLLVASELAAADLPDDTEGASLTVAQAVSPDAQAY